MARPKKSTKVKKLQGTLAKSREVKNEMELVKFEGIPAPPKKIKTVEGRKFWTKVCTELYNIGLLYEVHFPLIVAYCSELEMYNRMMGKIEREGDIFNLPTGHKMPHPAVSIKNKCILNMLKISNEFGLSPAAMTRINMPGKKKTGGLIK